MLHHHPGAFGPHPGFGLALLIVRLAFLALFLLLPLIIGLAYIWPDARRRGQPGWLWALTAIFLSWFGVLTYLVVRALTQPRMAATSPGALPMYPPASPAGYPPAPASPQPPVESPPVSPASDQPPGEPPNEQPPVD